MGGTVEHVTPCGVLSDHAMSVGNLGVMGRMAVFTGGVVLATFSLAACSSDTPASGGYPVTRIRRAAIENAQTSCHARPTSIEAIRSRYRRARTAMMTRDRPPGDVPDGFPQKGYGPDTAVYVVQMRGRFDCSGPLHQPLSNRSVMTQILDARTMEMRGYSVWNPANVNGPFPIREFGEVVAIPI